MAGITDNWNQQLYPPKNGYICLQFLGSTTGLSPLPQWVDTQIDARAYALYGLTDEEIAIVAAGV